MKNINRRAFLNASVGAVSAAAVSAPFLARELLGYGDYDPDTLFLTWQRDPTTTMTIQWIAPESLHDTSIRYNRLGHAASGMTRTVLKPYPNTDLKVHRAELTGLLPGSEYEFRIGSASRTYRFRTMPAKATNSFTFVTGGDCGTNEHAITTNKLAGRQDPQFVLIGGDLAYDNGESPETFTRFLQNYHQHVVDSEGRLIPLISCIGNHEVVGGYHARRSESPQYLSLFDGLFSERTFGVLDFGDYLSLVLLDTNHIAPVVGEQSDWLARTLAERQERPHVIAVNHVPAYPSHRAFLGGTGRPGTGEDQRIHWSPLFERYKVDCVLEHHDHTFKRSHPLTGGHVDKFGVLYLGDGSWGMLRTPHTPAERPYLAAVAQAYHMTMHRLEGEQQFHVALDDKGKVADVCFTKSKRASRRG